MGIRWRRQGQGRAGILPFALFLGALLSLSFGPGRSGDGREELVQILVGGDSTELEATLAELAPGQTSDLFLVYCEGGVPGPWIGAEEPFDRLEAPHLAAVRSALLALPGEALHAFLVRLSGGEGRLAYRTRGVELLGETGGAGDLRLLLRLAAPLRREEEENQGRTLLLPRAHREVFRAALEKILGRDSAAFPLLVTLFPEAEPSLTSAIVDAFRNSGRTVGMEALAALLGRGSAPDAYTLRAIEGMSRDLPGPFPREVISSVRSQFSSPAPDVLRVCMGVSAALEDWDAFPVLLEQLENSEARTRSAAVNALRTLTGLHFDDDPGIWTSWYQNELRWWDEERGRLLEDLENGDPAAVIVAVSSYAHRRFDRPNLVADLELALDRPEPDVVVWTCQALAELGSANAAGGLIELLESSDGRVRNAALDALRRITHKELPPDAELWRRVLLGE